MGNAPPTSVQDVLLVGCDNSGKTSIVKRLLGDETRTTTPTAGVNLKSVALDDRTPLQLWDVGGRQTLRQYWRDYARQARPVAIIFVIDAADPRRLAEVSIEVQKLLNDPMLVGVPLLVLANKQDVAGAIPPTELEACLNLGGISDRASRCLGCSALRGDGIVDAIVWAYGGTSPPASKRGRLSEATQRTKKMVRSMTALLTQSMAAMPTRRPADGAGTPAVTTGASQRRERNAAAAAAAMEPPLSTMQPQPPELVPPPPPVASDDVIDRQMRRRRRLQQSAESSAPAAPVAA